jgi:hypothetical protein
VNYFTQAYSADWYIPSREIRVREGKDTMRSIPKIENTPNAELCELTDAELDAVTGGDDPRMTAIGNEARAFNNTWLSFFGHWPSDPELKYQ